jgi:hypothetical protein
MPTLKERFTNLFKRRDPVSYGVKDGRGEMFFVEAHGFDVDRKGRLRFWKKGWLFKRLISVVQADEWKRILEGVSLEDFRGETWRT